MGDSLNLGFPSSGLTRITLEDNQLRSLHRVAYSHFSKQQGRLYENFEDVMVRAARQPLHRTADLYDLERVVPWRTVGEDEWIVVCNGWLRILSWNELCGEDEFLLGRGRISEISCIRSAMGGGSLSPVF